MKSEVGSFVPNSNSVTVLLNDATLNVKGIFLQVASTSLTGSVITGFTDGVENRSGAPRSTTYCIQGYSGTTLKVAGKSVAGGLSTPGEFTLSFPVFDGLTKIDFTVVGD